MDDTTITQVGVDDVDLKSLGTETPDPQDAPEPEPEPAKEPEKPAVEPAKEPEPEKEPELEPEVEYMTSEELDAEIAKAVKAALETQAPKKADAGDDLADDDPSAALAKRVDALEAEKKARDDAEALAKAEAETESVIVNQIAVAAKEMKMTAAEVTTVGAWYEKHPELIGVLPFDQGAVLAIPALAARKAPASAPDAKDGDPGAKSTSNGKPVDKVLANGAGSSPPTTKKPPGPGVGFDDLRRDAMKEYNLGSYT